MPCWDFLAEIQHHNYLPNPIYALKKHTSKEIDETQYCI